jgi:hypothetical protein
MVETNLRPFGNRITLNRFFDYDGVHYLAFDEVEVDAWTARYLIESGFGKLTTEENYENRNRRNSRRV